MSLLGILNQMSLVLGEDLLKERSFGGKDPKPIVIDNMKFASKICKDMAFRGSDDVIADIFIELSQDFPRYKFVVEKLNMLIALIEAEARYKNIYVLEDHKHILYISADIDWGDTFKKIPKTEEEIREALRCYLFNLNTACVFHLMRAVEYGIRYFASKINFNIPSKKPIEYQTWGEIASYLESIKRGLSNLPRGEDREDMLSFVSLLIADFTSFKDTCRNSVMHSRNLYDADAAKFLIERVRRFFECILKDLNKLKRYKKALNL